MVSLQIVRHPRQHKVVTTKTHLPALPLADDSSPPGLRGPTRRVCLVCQAKASAYTCPRCATPYCSATCYKGHNQGCTEGFYRHHVEQELGLRQAEDGGGAPGGKAARQATVDALRRVRLEGQGTGQEWLDEDRLEELLACGEALDLEALTPQEQQAFLAAVASGELGKDVKVWTPWWTQGGLSAAGTPLVVVEKQEEDEHEEGEEEACVTFATLYSQLQQETTKLPSSSPSRSKASPSPLLKFHLLDILFAYVAVLRTYNGCWAVAPGEATDDLLGLSAVLRQQPGQPAPPLESAAGALAHSMMALRQWRGLDTSSSLTAASSLDMGVALAQDVAAVLTHRVRAQAALLDAARLVHAALWEVLGESDDEREKEEETAAHLADKLEALTVKASGGGEKSSSKQQRHAGKNLLRTWHKLRFFLHWAMQVDDDVEWQGLQAAFGHALQDHQAVVGNRRSAGGVGGL